MLQMIAVAGLANLLLVASAMAPPAAAPQETTPSAKMLERFKTLTGDWEGMAQWTGSRTDSYSVKVTYHVASAGSAVVEDYVMGDKSMMMSVYHLDEADLRMTHFCGAQNQPRLKADKIDPVGGNAHFALVDVTNAVSHPAYVHAFAIQLVDADHINLQFTFQGKGAPAIESIALHRAAAAPSPG